MKNVQVYSTPTCPYCIKAKKFLEESGVEYEEKDVSSSAEAADEAVKKSGQMGVPVLDIEGEIIVGFDKDAIRGALGL
jgi:glutaredoxin 3